VLHPLREQGRYRLIDPVRLYPVRPPLTPVPETTKMQRDHALEIGETGALGDWRDRVKVTLLRVSFQLFGRDGDAGGEADVTVNQDPTGKREKGRIHLIDPVPERLKKGRGLLPADHPVPDKRSDKMVNGQVRHVRSPSE
jgi:hypothetical protein